MKRIVPAFLGASLLASITMPAGAAEIPVKAPVAKAPAVAVFDWSGFYAGVDAGKLRSRGELLIAPTVTANPDPDGTVLGGHLGYRRQLPSGFVLGIEADAWHDSGGEPTDPYTGAPGQGGLDLKWGASARAQLGYALGPGLAYATGGLAYISYEGCAVHNVLAPCMPGSAYNGDSWGWTAGAGLAYAITNNLSARVEYLYSDYGQEAVSTPGIAGGRTLIDIRSHTVRAGVSWKFSSR
jgi:outer membrane immunogenic protein